MATRSGAKGSGFIRNRGGSHEFQWNEECCFASSVVSSLICLALVVLFGAVVGKKSRLPSFLASQVSGSKTLL